MNTSHPCYKILDHTADLGIIVKGKDLPSLFRNAGAALLDIMIRGNSHEKPKSMNLNVTGTDLPDLMVKWLGEILYIFDGEGQIASSINIHSISNNSLDATLTAVAFDPEIHKVLTEIKAVTYHRIEVVEKCSVWEARVIFDL
ncbi:MAG: archease [Deltaproteobacteria bacterium]|nr:archease [Deltaproteobacteria bacterium]